MLKRLRFSTTIFAISGASHGISPPCIASGTSIVPPDEMSSKSLPTYSHLVPKFTPKQVDTTPENIGLEALFNTQCHLGHSPSIWNSYMLPFIYGERQGIHIINLEHTLVALRRACGVAQMIAQAGGNIVFVGSKPMLHNLVYETARECSSYYLLEWVRGTITNRARVLRRSVGHDPSTVVQSLKGPIDLDALLSQDELNSSEKAFSKPYVHRPDLLIILDMPNNLDAIREANLERIPVIAICDTDCDPTIVQYPIPANDDSLSGVTLIAQVLSKSIQAGMNQ